MIVYCVKDFYLSYKYIAIYIWNVFLTWIYCHVHKQRELDIHFSRPLYCCPNYYLVDGICKSKKTRARMAFQQCHNKQYIILLLLSQFIISECPNGTFGRNCLSTCPEIFYGEFCVQECNCKKHELCNPIHGCKGI